MKNTLPTLLTLATLMLGCESRPKETPPPVSQPLDAVALEALRSDLGEGVLVAGVSRVLPTDEFLAIENANVEQFPVGTPVSIIDSNKNTIAHGSVAALVQGEVHVQFAVTGARRPEVGDAVVAFPRR
jgi:hypothetical protein